MAERESSDALKPRSAKEAAQRVLALLVAIGKVHDPEQSAAWMKKHNLQQILSPAEVALVQAKRLSEESRLDFSWRAEAIVSLLWALQALPEMPPLDEQFNIFEVDAVRLAMKDPPAFVSNARLRVAREIKDMESNLYHQHWRVRDAEIGGIGESLEQDPEDPPIEELNPAIVYERRYGLSWLVGWGEDWDNVPTDT